MVDGVESGRKIKEAKTRQTPCGESTYSSTLCHALRLFIVHYLLYLPQSIELLHLVFYVVSFEMYLQNVFQFQKHAKQLSGHPLPLSYVS